MLGLIAAVLAVLLLFKNPEGQRSAVPLDDSLASSAAESLSGSTQGVTGNVSLPIANSTATNATPAFVIEQLRTLRPGHVSAFEAESFVRFLKQQPTATQAELDALLLSTSEVDRVLAAFLILEVIGPSPEFLDRTASDPSPYVPAEAAAWLYSAGRFEEWNDYLNGSLAVMTADQLTAVMAKLDSRPVRLEVPAAMSLLGIGRRLEDYVTEIMRRSSVGVSVAQGQLASSTVPEIQKENLLKLLHDANPSEYNRILREIIAASQDDRPLRWQAVWNFGQTAADVDSLTFVSSWTQQHATDLLHDKLQEASVSIAARVAETASASEALEQRLMAATATATTPEHQRFALFSHYVRDCIRNGREGNASLLSPFRAELTNRPVTDAPLRRLIADIDYVLWRANQ